jgi:deoxycytidine triphosphate deaminase
MILLHDKIKLFIRKGVIVFHGPDGKTDETKIGPNSVDITISPIVRRVKATARKRQPDPVMGPLHTWPWRDLTEHYWSTPEEIPDGWEIEIQPGETILAVTNEAVGTRSDFVPILIQRSGTGRIGLLFGAGFGDVGYDKRWTLEIFNGSESVIHIPPGAKVGQVYFVRGEGNAKYTGSYGQTPWTAADMIPKLFNDLKRDRNGLPIQFPETDPKPIQTDPSAKAAESMRNQYEDVWTRGHLVDAEDAGRLWADEKAVNTDTPPDPAATAYMSQKTILKGAVGEDLKAGDLIQFDPPTGKWYGQIRDGKRLTVDRPRPMVDFELLDKMYRPSGRPGDQETDSGRAMFTKQDEAAAEGPQPPESGLLNIEEVLSELAELVGLDYTDIETIVRADLLSAYRLPTVWRGDEALIAECDLYDYYAHCWPQFLEALELVNAGRAHALLELSEYPRPGSERLPAWYTRTTSVDKLVAIIHAASGDLWDRDTIERIVMAHYETGVLSVIDNDSVAVSYRPVLNANIGKYLYNFWLGALPHWIQTLPPDIFEREVEKSANALGVTVDQFVKRSGLEPQ